MLRVPGCFADGVPAGSECRGEGVTHLSVSLFILADFMTKKQWLSCAKSLSSNFADHSEVLAAMTFSFNERGFCSGKSVLISSLGALPYRTEISGSSAYLACM